MTLLVRRFGLLVDSCCFSYRLQFCLDTVLEFGSADESADEDLQAKLRAIIQGGGGGLSDSDEDDDQNYNGDNGDQEDDTDVGAQHVDCPRPFLTLLLAIFL